MGEMSLQSLSFPGHGLGGDFDMTGVFGRAPASNPRVACHEDTLEKEALRPAEGIPLPQHPEASVASNLYCWKRPKQPEIGLLHAPSLTDLKLVIGYLWDSDSFTGP